MYQLLIVDDEIHAVRAIQSGVEWKKLPINQIHVALNIRQAMEIFTKNTIDIMICDIEMPQGNGLELLTWVRERFPSIVSIFLTCHSDFAYAKRAIKLGSFDYMLKPVNYHELQTVIHKATEKLQDLQEQKLINETRNHYLKLWSSHQPLLIERFWQDLLNQTIPSNPNQVREVLLRQNFPFNENEQFLPILICVQHWFKKISIRDEKIMEYALWNAAVHMILQHYEQSQMVHIRSDALLVLIPVGKHNDYDKERLKQDCESYIKSCHEYFYCDLSCYVGKRGSICEMVTLFNSLLEMKKNNVNQNNKVFFLGEEIKNNGSVDLIQMNVWLEMLKQGAREAIFIQTEQYLNAWKSVKGLEAKMLEVFFQSFLQMLYQFIQFKGLNAYQALDENISSERMSLAIRSVTDLQFWVNDSLQKTIEFCRLVESTQSVMDKIKKYIAQNLSQSISREDIASHVHLHPDYLSRLFKKEMAKSIVEYISEEKVDIAKKLLVQTNLSVSGISTSLGYSNFSYFAKMFKKATQMKPHEFRKSFQSSSRLSIK